MKPRAFRLRGRSLLELNVSSLSDWPLAYRRVAFAYDGRANRLQVSAELLPRGEASPQDDTALLQAWVNATCRQAGRPASAAGAAGSGGRA